MALPQDYVERVYAGVLGKIIGVYLGRPFEGWSHERILQELGEVNYYVHERLKVPLIVTDDDISGTFTFLSALPDYENRRDLTPAQIGQSWLNYLIERRTILWWGGLGNSTEHTAFMRLKHGIQAPQSGSIALNGKVVAEQIGAQIFIDGWAMVAPGDPALAADLARRAGSVSHDGEAIYGAQVLAAMEAAAFVEAEIDTLLDTGVEFIPHDSIIYRMIDDIRGWHAATPDDWRKTRSQIEANYGYDKYGGNCHMVPNHGLIIHGLLHGGGDFQRSLMIVNTCGWDTDCNSGNLGCLLGIRNGLAGLDNSGPDWRGPVADRMYLPTADGGRAITDAVHETIQIVNVARALAGQAPIAPKAGTRFHFELPGSMQGFQPEESTEVRGVVTLENVVGHSEKGERSLAIHYRALAPGRAARVATPTFTPSAEVARYFSQRGYALLASPQLYPGQTVSAAVEADAANALPVRTNLYLQVYGANDALTIVRGPEVELAPGSRQVFEWTLPDTSGFPIAVVGVEARSETHASGTLYLDYLTWEGTPQASFRRPGAAGDMWRHAWVNGVDQYDHWWPESFRLAQNEGRGLLITGTREWTDYSVQATMRPHLVKNAGIAARVQGMRRFYALLLSADGMVRLVKALDGDKVLAESALNWEFGGDYALRLTVQGQNIVGYVDGREVVRAVDNDRPLTGGGVAIVIEEGRMSTEEVRVGAV
jgi:ADP-ribosylglycohydrolase